MRNPFRSQTENPAPTLRERAADLRVSLQPAPATPAALPAPGSPEAMAAWHAACHEHSKRSAPLHECAELMDPEGGVWTKGSLGRALETGGISVAEYARLYPLASERELRLDQIGHELNTAVLFALAYADEYPQKPEAQGKPRDAYGPADQLVYDINATIMQRGQGDPNAVAPVPFTLSETALVPTVDFAGANMSELREIYEAAELLCEVASTATHNPHGRAGKLARWVSNALCAVHAEAEDEARRRTPSNGDDRATRLSMIFGTTLDNEDPAEIAAFARELLAMVEP